MWINNSSKIQILIQLKIYVQKTATHAQTIDALNTELGLMIFN